ncbi:hypothetical protein ABFX02_10G106700 [Erythranthe guttata]
MENQCFCGNMLVQRTSWTERNPGRRYNTCIKYKEPSGCNFFAWIDPPMGYRATHIIPGLLRRVNGYEVEIARRRSREKKLWILLVCSWMMIYWLFGSSNRGKNYGLELA